MEQPVVTTPSVNSFKTDWINIEHHKNWDTIGKQNYQEPATGSRSRVEFWVLPVHHYMF